MMDVFFDPKEREAFGVIVPFDMELDSELWRWVPADIDLLLTRTPFLDDTVNVEFIRNISDTAPIASAARDLTAGRVQTVAYACASGSFIGGADGERELREAILRGGAVQGLTTSGAFVEALGHLGVSRVALATPYVVELSAYLEAFLGEYDVEVTGHSALGLDSEIWAVDQHVTADLIRQVDSPSTEAIVVSCTNLATYDILAPLEAELGKPVLAANQVTMWAALRRLGREAIGPGQMLLEAAGAIPIVPSAYEAPVAEAETIA